MALATSAVA